MREHFRLLIQSSVAIMASTEVGSCSGSSTWVAGVLAFGLCFIAEPEVE